MRRRWAGVLCVAAGLCLTGCDVSHEYVTQEFSAPLETAGADVEYHEYDTGHKLNAQGMRELKAWWDGRQAQTKT